jgi:putative transposase
LRNVEYLLFERGTEICHETVRFWWNRFGPMFAADIRRQRVSRMRGFNHWRWYLNEMYVKIGGRCITSGAQSTKKALKRHGCVATITSDGLRSSGSAMDVRGNREKQAIDRWANNRVENSPLPFRRRERAMLRFRQMKPLQKFASVHAPFHNHFASDRHLIDQQTYKLHRSAALAEWQSLTT